MPLDKSDEQDEPTRLTKRGISYFKGHCRAFLKVQDGCNNSCAYCKVPLVRGASRSRLQEEIIQEAKRLAKNGFKEIVLTGICLGAYGRDLSPRKELLDLIQGLEKVRGLLRIRLSSIEAADITDSLIDKMATSRKLCPHLHIPVQSADNQVLRRMQRNYTQEAYLKLMRKIKKRIPQVAITTDVLVGFPGETEENFRHTVDLIKKIQPLKVHIFPFSQREATPAAGFRPLVSPLAIKQRVKLLGKVAAGCAQKYKSRFLNKKMPVLVEARVKGSSDTWEGHTDNYIKVKIKADCDLKNEVIPVRLDKIVEDGFLCITHWPMRR